ncbi:hypothetical protein ACJX0J_018294, partial [Zea mays]
ELDSCQKHILPIVYSHTQDQWREFSQHETCLGPNDVVYLQDEQEGNKASKIEHELGLLVFGVYL